MTQAEQTSSVKSNQYTDDSLVIDQSNFNQYFFDARTNPPKKGQVLACYETKADFVDGNLKRDIIHLLMTNPKAGESTTRLLNKVGGATHKSSIDVIKQMTSDLLSGMSSDDVSKKPYEMHCQFFYYTQKELIPNDPHWWSTSLIDATVSGNLDVKSE